MGHHEGWAQPNCLLLNGLLPNEEASVTRPLELERWMIAEERTAELIACIQPNQPSEELRNAVADYVQRLIMKCFSCQVFTFGSVPLKTYLPDGDIDLTFFSKNQNLKDTWANEVRIMLGNEEKSDTAEFRVKEVQYIQAEVKIIKCLVENIVVDISFNQLGGLCTLCFLEEVDHKINQNHLFKRSIILIKAWCYYESRILGAHHGLISTYALEMLVLYIFHVFNNSFAGPLEVLYRFLEFFSSFDWDNFCISLWGPIPINALPDMTAESPRKDRGELLLDKLFLNTCTSVYAVVQSGQDNQGQAFVSKHFNVVDPLRTNNNLGRSVSKGNFFRIRSAFAFGAKTLARLLDCPKEELIAEVNQFFMNTWDRHGSGDRPDAPISGILRLRPLNLDPLDGSENLKHHSESQIMNENTSKYESETEDTRSFHGFSSEHGSHPSESMSRTTNISGLCRTQSQKNYVNVISPRVSGQIAGHISCSNETVHTEKVQSSRPYLVNEVQGRFQFARTHSSPELSDTSFNEISSQGSCNKTPEMAKSQIVASRPDHNGRRRENLCCEVSGCHSTRSSTEDSSSWRHSSSHQILDNAADSNNASNSLRDEAGLSAMGEELASFVESMEMHQKEQDLVNMMASSAVHGFTGQIQMPMNLASPHLPIPISPSILASMGYAQRNLAGMVPTKIPSIEPPWGTNMQFPQGMGSSPLSHYFHSVGFASNPEEIIESADETSGLREMNHEGDRGLWHGRDASSTRGLDHENGNFGSSSPLSSSGSSFIKDQQKFVKENIELVREDCRGTFRYQNDRQNEFYSETTDNLRFLPTSHASSSRSKVFAESALDGPSVKFSKSSRNKKGRKTSPSLAPSTVCGKGKTGWQYEVSSIDHGSSQANDDNQEWISLSTVDTDMAERSIQPASNKISSYDSVQISGSDSMIPIAPMFVGSGSQQRTMDNSGVVPFAFYPTGPPVPFLTMLPVYNVPTESGNSEGSPSHFDREERQDSNLVNQSDQNFDSAEILDHSDSFSSSHAIKVANSLEFSEEHKPDILHSDFASHWQNLQYGRECQNPRYHGGPLIYPSPVAVPPMYLHGHFPWDGPGRPLSGNVNLLTQLMGYGPHMVPVAPQKPGSTRPTAVYQRYGDEVPRYRGGTGTYLPNPKVTFRDRQSSGPKNHRGIHDYDRSDHHGDREGNWNVNSKPRPAVRSHSRSLADKPSSRSDRANKPWDSYRHESFPSCQSQTGPFGSSNPTHNGSTSVTYGMYPLPTVSSNGVAPTGPGVPSVVMLYSYGDHSFGYSSPSDQLEFGSLGPVHFPGMNEVSQLGEGEGSTRGVYEQQRFRGDSPARSSPDQPPSPQLQRGV